MVRWSWPLLFLALGCQTWSVPEQGCSSSSARGFTYPQYQTEIVEPAMATPRHLNLEGLWSMALQHNPELREAVADVDAARGQVRQAGAYPNPRFSYQEDVLGSRLAREGNISLALHQEIVTAGKRQLDQAIASRGVDQATFGLTGRRFQLLTRLRRGYYDYVNLLATSKVNRETVASLEEAIRLTRQLVEKAKTRPQTDLLALETLLEEARINQDKTRGAGRTAWQQLAAEVGLPNLAPPESVENLPEAVPQFQEAAVVSHVLAVHSALQEVRAEAESARLAVARARAEAIPNITVSGGYTLENLEHTAGAMVSVETPLPLWDRKQGHIHQAEARYAKTQAAARSLEVRLQRDAAEAWGRYRTAQQNLERLTREVLPRLQKRRELLRQAYQAGAGQVSFSDVLLTEQALQSARLNLADTRRELWRAIADLEGWLQLEVRDEGNKR